MKIKKPLLVCLMILLSQSILAEQHPRSNSFNKIIPIELFEHKHILNPLNKKKMELFKKIHIDKSNLELSTHLKKYDENSGRDDKDAFILFENDNAYIFPGKTVDDFARVAYFPVGKKFTNYIIGISLENKKNQDDLYELLITYKDLAHSCKIKKSDELKNNTQLTSVVKRYYKENTLQFGSGNDYLSQIDYFNEVDKAVTREAYKIIDCNIGNELIIISASYNYWRKDKDTYGAETLIFNCGSNVIDKRRQVKNLPNCYKSSDISIGYLGYK